MTDVFYLQKMPGSSSASKRSMRTANKGNSDGTVNVKMSKTNNDAKVATKMKVTKGKVKNILTTVPKFNFVSSIAPSMANNFAVFAKLNLGMKSLP